MPPRSSWKGFIRFSLVTLPVKAYTASATSAEIHLRQLHRACNSPINYRKVCPIHGEIPNEEIVSGYEHVKGQFVVLDPEEVKNLREEGTKAVTIEGFVPKSTIDPIFYAGKTHYLIPDGPIGQKPYALLQRVMSEDGVTALAKVILAGREQIVLLWPRDRLITMSTLSFEREIKETVSFDDELTEAEVSSEELRLAKTLMEASTLEAFELSVYKDTYNERLTELIQAKLEGKQVVTPPEPEIPNVINLMDALKDSIIELKKKVASAEAGKKKMAPSARETAEAPRKRKTGRA